MGAFQFSDNQILVCGGWNANAKDDVLSFQIDDDIQEKLSPFESALNRPDFFLVNGPLIKNIYDDFIFAGHHWTHQLKLSTMKFIA